MNGNQANHKINFQLALLSGFITICSFTFIQQGSDWIAPESAKQIKNPVVPDEASLALGKKAYVNECLLCHGRKGKGDGPNMAILEKLPGNLTSAKIQSQTDGEIFWKITEGRKPMPSAKKTLTEDQRWQVINYIRTLKK